MKRNRWLVVGVAAVGGLALVWVATLAIPRGAAVSSRVPVLVERGGPHPLDIVTAKVESGVMIHATLG